MKIMFSLPVLLICSGLMLVQPAFAAREKKVTLSELRQRIEKLEKEQPKQTIPAASASAERSRMFVEQPGQHTQPRFMPYSYP